MSIYTYIFSEWSILFIGALLLLLVYKIGHQNYDFFEKKGIAFTQPQVFVGNFEPVLFQKTSLFELTASFYNTYKKNKYLSMF